MEQWSPALRVLTETGGGSQNGQKNVSGLLRGLRGEERAGTVRPVGVDQKICRGKVKVERGSGGQGTPGHTGYTTHRAGNPG